MGCEKHLGFPLAVIVDRMTGKPQSLVRCDVETQEGIINWKAGGIEHLDTSSTYKPRCAYDSDQEIGDVFSSPIKRVIRITDYPPNSPAVLS